MPQYDEERDELYLSRTEEEEMRAYYATRFTHIEATCPLCGGEVLIELDDELVSDLVKECSCGLRLLETSEGYVLEPADSDDGLYDPRGKEK